MEKIDQIYMWKRLYWQAIDAGFEPGAAERFAHCSLSCDPQTPTRRAPKVRISWACAVAVP